MSSLKFGTSGLRGLATDLEGQPSYAYAAAFLRVAGAEMTEDRVLLIGRDFRPSSPAIAAAVAAAARDEGFEVFDCGVLPTPALALEAMRRRAAAVMVTGSHIPDDRNGLKFYKSSGEITKADEPAIVAAVEGVGHLDTPIQAATQPEALARYAQRYRDAFPAGTLDGLTVAVYQQSSVARDLITDLLTDLGARVLPVGRSEVFVPIDTEAHRPEDVAFIRRTAESNTVDALVTTDGDADRPLIADARGTILRGDVIGLITARHLGVDTIVVPVTAGSALERAGGFRRVLRTRVGSPHVIAGMETAAREGAERVAGFEANGGFLLGSAASIAGRMLAPLPTRDAMLPIIATLAASRQASVSLQALVDSLHAGETAADRLEHVPADRSGALLQRLADDDFVTAFVRPIGMVQAVSRVDGTRIDLDGDRTIHFRPSGNAPELRCYAEAPTRGVAEELVRWGLNAAAEDMSRHKA